MRTCTNTYMAFFCSLKIELIFVEKQFAQTLLQYVIYGRTSELYSRNKVAWGTRNFNLEIIPILLEMHIVTWCK